MAQVLRPVQDHPAGRHPDLIVGFETADDAGVYALGDGRALVQTVDIFAPIVDLPYDWGRIAAANALSDVYAMGATPMTALQYLAWPRDELSFDLAGEVLSGGMDVMAEAGCTVVGGHSIDGPEPHYGFAVTGLADTTLIKTNSGALAGEALVLTKPLGIGIISTAIKHGRCSEALAANAIETMAALNQAAGAAATAHNASAVTDVTGFGLLGHLREMCRASGAGARVEYSRVPVINGVAELLAEGMWAGGSQRNLEFLESEIDSSVEDDQLRILVDAQTSGGLLVSLPPEEVEGFLSDLAGAAVIGSITAGHGITVLP